MALLACVLLGCGLPGCAPVRDRPAPSAPPGGAFAPLAPRPGDPLRRRGDEIMVAGRLVHTGAPVVLWTDPGGYDAYRVERRFAPPDRAAWDPARPHTPTPNRYGRRDPGDPETRARVRADGWTPAHLAGVVDQLVIHYDACGTSRQCFRVLHDIRGLSAHFLLDLDGTIYQTLDLKDRAWHATKANNRSIGVEIANIGAYPRIDASPLVSWYAADEHGTRITLPPERGDGGIRTPGFVGRPDRPRPVAGAINGQHLVMYDLTPEQYDSLIRLAATLAVVFPRLELAFPAGRDGRVLARALSDAEFRDFRGVLGHWHVQPNKLDPGPAFDWNRVVDGARALRRAEHGDDR